MMWGGDWPMMWSRTDLWCGWTDHWCGEGLIVDVEDQHILLGRANRWCGKDWPSMWGDWLMMWGWTDHWCEWTGCWCGVTDSWCGRTNWWCGEGLTDVGGLNDDVGGSNDDLRKYWDIDLGKDWELMWVDQLMIRGRTKCWCGGFDQRCGVGLAIVVFELTIDVGKDLSLMWGDWHMIWGRTNRRCGGRTDLWCEKDWCGGTDC